MGTQEQRMLQAVEDSLGPAIVDANVLAQELDDALEVLGDLEGTLEALASWLGHLGRGEISV